MRQQLVWLDRMVSVRKRKARMIDGRLRTVWTSMHLTPIGVKYNRLLRLRRRLHGFEE